MSKFLSYCYKPIYVENVSKCNAKTILKFFLLYMAIGLILTFPIKIITDIFNLTHDLNTELPTNIILYGVFIAPYLEEVLFRLILKPIKSNSILLIVVICFSICFFLIFKQNYYVYFLIILSLIYLLVVFIYKIFKINYRRNFKWIFYLSVFLFAIIHLLNYEGIEILHLLICVFLVAPQIFLGFVLGYVRMIYGFGWAVFFHYLVNIFLLTKLI